MAKRAKRAAKTGPDKASRWTVRGVAVPLQRAASEAARARGQTLGQWLSEVVEGALADAPGLASASAAAGWREAIEARLARLEDVVGVDTTPRSAGESVGVVAN
jgi:hypothetical protein